MTEIVLLDGTEERAAEIEAFKGEFLRYAAMPDLTKPCPLGRLLKDFNGVKLRQETWQVVDEAMSDRPEFTRRAMELLCELAQYDKRARSLLDDMAAHWAELRCDL